MGQEQTNLNMSTYPINESRFIYDETTNADGTKTIIDTLNNYTIHYSESSGYIAYNESGEEVYWITTSGPAVFYKNDGDMILTDKIMTINDVTPNMTVTDHRGYLYSISNDGKAEIVTDFTRYPRFYEKENDGISKIILDRKNDYEITFTEQSGYIAYDKLNQEVYHIYPDKTVSIKVDNKDIVLHNSDLKIDDMLVEQTITDDNGVKYYISNGKLKKQIEYNKDGSILLEYNYNDDGSYQAHDYEMGNTVFLDKKGNPYRIDESDGRIFLIDSDVYLKSDGTFNTKTGETGIYSFDDNGNIVCHDGNGDICYYGGERCKLLKRVSEDGTIYEYNNDKESQRVTKTRKVTYSRINHIAYDEEAYDKILITLNNIGNSYKSTIASACSSIESSINGFPDSYSSSGIDSVGSSIEGHIDLINSLSEMTNYSLLAYQTCDDNLKDGLYQLIDSLFDDSEKKLGERFKKIIQSSIEDRDGDDILEYKEATDFKTLSETAIVYSTFEDEDGNKWYLSKNNTVIGIDGENIKVNYGGTIFNVSYNQDGVIVLKDNDGNDIDIFGDYNLDSSQYGGNQCFLSSSYDNLYVNNTLSKFFPEATDEERIAFLSRVAEVGCGYTAVTNFVFKQFEGKEDDFYKMFGYPMYDIKYSDNSGLSVDYNYEPLIVDLYCESNKRVHSFFSKDYEGPMATSPEILSQMFNYLKNDYGIKIDNVPIGMKFISDGGYSLYNMDGSLYLSDGGGHAMVEVGKNEKGQSIVSSWGLKFIYEPSDDEFIQNKYDSIWKEGIDYE